MVLSAGTDLNPDMTQKQRHRGRHPEDDRLFAEKWIETLRTAVCDLSYLFSRDYAQKAALKVVGDHYQLDARQRRAILRAACSDASLKYRAEHHVSAGDLKGKSIIIDGYNFLITVESVLSGGILLRGRDGCIRDMASVHGSYHKVQETSGAILLMGNTLDALGIDQSQWYFDAPVSNSGRLRKLLSEYAEDHGWNWDVKLANNVDNILAESDNIVITSDSWIMDRAGCWATVMEQILSETGTVSEVIDLGQEDGSH